MNWPLIPYIIGAVLVAALLIGFLIVRARIRRFRPTPDKQAQADALNADLQPTGFAYQPQGDYFYSLMDGWQRKVGYCRLYDEGAPLFNMIMDCEPIPFSYDGKRWLIELWKGQYGITTGAEIGVYNTRRADIQIHAFTGTFYENIPDEERLPLSFVLRKGKTVLLKRRALHWWLTGFKLGEFSSPASLVMEAKLKFPNREMCKTFVDSLRNIGYEKGEFSVFRTTVTIRFDKPHTLQPPAQEGVSKTLIQAANQSNCRLYQTATARYADTLDKLEFLKAAMPELDHLFLRSLYSKAFFETFEWLPDFIHGHLPDSKPPEPPQPPAPPEPPFPEPPIPPQPPCSEPPVRPCPPCPPPWSQSGKGGKRYGYHKQKNTGSDPEKPS